MTDDNQPGEWYREPPRSYHGDADPEFVQRIAAVITENLFAPDERVPTSEILETARDIIDLIASEGRFRTDGVEGEADE